jgi:MFS superfamily sulfate permease-like transporter
VFYVILTIALGTMFKGRGPVAGIAVGFILACQFFTVGRTHCPSSMTASTPGGSRWVMAGVYGVVAQSILVVNGGRLGVPRSRGTDAIVEAQTECRVQY